ncbi:MAG: CehA/McbA family metallohydrolase [Acidobacteria bacterium]|nr:CehA/McbA family metallohydrolase [Acidobacteriota bacterium]
MRLRTHVVTCGLLVVIIGAVAQQRTTPVLLSRPPLGLPVNNGYPALARGSSGDLWLAWVSSREFDRAKRGSDADFLRADHVMVKRRGGTEWSPELRVSTEHTMNSDPAVATDASGAWVIWAARVGTEWDLWMRHVDTAMKMTAPVRITSAVGSDAVPRAAAAPDGTLWVVWEAQRNGVTQIHAMRKGRFDQPELVSVPDAPAYRPSLTISAAGRVTVAWDGGSGERYGVSMRQWANGQWSAVIAAPVDRNLDAYGASVAAGRGDSVWLAYAQNPERAPEWGIRGWRPGAMPRPRVRALEWTGSVWRDPGLHVTNADMPVAAASHDGGVHVILTRMKGHCNFRLWSTAFTANGWTEPQQLDVNEEEYSAVRFMGAASTRMDQRPSAVIHDGKVHVAYERGTGIFENRQIAVRDFAAAGSAPDNAALYRAPAPAPAAAMRPVRAATPTVNGYQVYFGEIHMHLMMDDGHTGIADQYYAFARDRWLLDFAAYTPHAESNKLLSSEVGMVQRVVNAFHQPGRFVGIPGWEWTQGDFRVPQEGHKNVISETDDQPFFSSTEGDSDTAKELTALMRTTTSLMFAHHVARGSSGGTNFDAIDPRVEPDMEIASHWGRFEFYRNPGHTRDEIRGSSLQDAWRRGLRIGVVGGSDNHDLFMERPAAFTAVLAEKLDRASIFGALKARRCYATTGERIVLDVRVNGQPMGSVVRSAQAPVITVTARGTNAIERIEVIKFYKGVPEPFPAVYAVTPNAPAAAFEWRDLEFRGEAAYYVRLTQRSDPRVTGKQNFGSATSYPNDMAWSSPIWVNQ